MKTQSKLQVIALSFAIGSFGVMGCEDLSTIRLSKQSGELASVQDASGDGSNVGGDVNSGGGTDVGGGGSVPGDSSSPSGGSSPENGSGGGGSGGGSNPESGSGGGGSGEGSTPVAGNTPSASPMPGGDSTDDHTAVPPEADGGDSMVLCDNPKEIQVKICHVPEGNPAAKHTLCVGLKGAINGHRVNFDSNAVGGHGGDYSGACKD